MSAGTVDPTAQRSAVLDNAAWHSLRGAHAATAEGQGAALRYRHDVSVFSATPGNGPDSWAALAALAGPGGLAVLFRAIPQTPPPGWRRLRGGPGVQMVLDGPLAGPAPPPSVDGATGEAVAVRALQAHDVPAMQALVELTEPGPFRPRTIELGGYVGLFHGDALVAMAGQRLRPPGHCEVSAVCTHPAARRRGYASFLTASVAARILERGERAFLHAATTNDAAIRAYRALGFRVRTTVDLGVLRAPG